MYKISIRLTGMNLQVQYEINRSVQVQYKINRNVQVQYEINRNVQDLYEINRNAQVHYVINRSVQVQYEINRNVLCVVTLLLYKLYNLLVVSYFLLLVLVPNLHRICILFYTRSFNCIAIIIKIYIHVLVCPFLLPSE